MRRLMVVVAMVSATSATQATGAERVLVPEGAFQMGCSHGDELCEKDEGAAGGRAVNVPAFLIDVREVTVSEYEACIAAGKCDRPKDHQRNKYCNVGAEGRGDHPANCVDWKDAVNYCEFVGARLPFEAEWEKASRAGTSTSYPWGNSVDCTRAILDDGVTQGSVKGEPDGCGEDRTWPVGSRPANKLGLFDMHGNAGEWTANWYAPDAYEHHYAKGDLKGPDSGVRRVVRGGSWDENRSNLRSSFRNVKPPVSGSSIYGSIGFRCAEDAK